MRFAVEKREREREGKEGKFANFGLSQSTAKRNQGQAKVSVSSSSSTSRPFLLTLPGGQARVGLGCSLHDVWQPVQRCVLETHVVRAEGSLCWAL